jgi:hypothetical protein
MIVNLRLNKAEACCEKFYVILDFINFNCDKVARKTEKPGTKYIYKRATGCRDTILYMYLLFCWVYNLQS